MADPVKVTLRTPIALGEGRSVDELTIRPVTGKDMRRLSMVAGLEMDTLLVLAGRLSGQPDVVIDRLSGEDLEEVISIVSGFMPGGRRTGKTPSQS